MTDTVTFQNPGLIPIEAVTTMGVSVKEGDTPIGFFGTGLKYSIASLLRTGQRIVIWRGLERYDFVVQQEKVRDKEFGFIYMGQADVGLPVRLGFTTHLGAKWEMWQIFRELHSNALDEGGGSTLGRLEPKEGHTTIWAEGVQIVEAAAKKSEVFLGSLPLASLPGVDIHHGATRSLYYRGVRVATLDNPALFTYNLTGRHDLTEDRTLTGMFWVNNVIVTALANSPDDRFLVPVLLSKDTYEATFRFGNVGEEFHERVLALAQEHGILAVNASALAAAEGWARHQGRVKKAELSTEDHGEIKKAKRFLEAIGYPVDAPVVVAESLGPGVFGMARHGTIYLSRNTLDRGGRFLISTLLEERLHLTHKFLDQSRAFQDFLLDMAIRFACEARGLQAPEGQVRPVTVVLGVDPSSGSDVGMPF